MDGEIRERRLVAGDDTALAEAYDLHAAAVYGVALRVTRSRHGAQDVTQTVFVGLWEHSLAFDPARGRLVTWLRTLAHRRAVDWVRHEEVRRRALPSTVVSDDPGADELALRAELNRRVRGAVTSLPQPLREVIELSYFGGRTYREVAVELGVPEGTAKSRIRRALRHLAEELRAEGTVP